MGYLQHKKLIVEKNENKHEKKFYTIISLHFCWDLVFLMVL